MKNIRPGYTPISNTIRIVNRQQWLDLQALKALQEERKRLEESCQSNG